MINIFSKRLKYLRIYHNITQKRLAEKLNITPRVISNYECGKAKPTCQAVVDFAQFFNVSSDYLLGLSDRFAPARFVVTVKANKTKKK